jgi:hypothetical protein
MANKRVFYAVQALGFAQDGTSVFTTAHGVQSIGITTTFNLEQVFEMGQVAIYENIEQIPDVELTAEKVLDGYPLLWHLATKGATTGTLGGRQNIKTIAALAVFDDTRDSASGTAIAEVHMSGMVISSLAYQFPVEGNCTESVTVVGNTKKWKDIEGGTTAVFTGAFTTNADAPTGTGGVQRRENVLFVPLSGSPTTTDANSMSKAYCTILPTDIYGISASGTNPQLADGSFTVPIQSIGVSVDLGRQEIFQLGRKVPYHRSVSFPTEVRTDIEVLATKWDGISGTEAGGENGAAAGSNLKNQTIRIQMEEGTRIDLGTKNKLQSVAWGGGDAGQGGGNVTNKYTYVTHNTLNVYHPQDPSSLAFVYG